MFTFICRVFFFGGKQGYVLYIIENFSTCERSCHKSISNVQFQMSEINEMKQFISCLYHNCFYLTCYIYCLLYYL